MKKNCVGIDIAKLNFVSAIKLNDKNKVKSFQNNEKRFKEFSEWLQQFPADTYHFCMKSTGKYGNALALFLYNNHHLVSIVNPAKIKYFMRSQLSRNKTDSVDAKFIRYYCEIFSPAPWKPLSLERQALQELVKRSDTLNNMLRQEQNRLENADKIIRKSIDDIINYLKNEIKIIDKRIEEYISAHAKLNSDSKLLRSIPGIGEKTTSKALAFLGDMTEYNNAKQVAAFVGLNPKHAQSGTSLNYSCISRTGDAKLRKMFYPRILSKTRFPGVTD